MTPEFVKNYLEKFFDDLDTNVGRKFPSNASDSYMQEFRDIEALRAIIPKADSFKNLKNQLDDVAYYVPELRPKTEVASHLLNLYETLVPDESVFTNMEQGLTQQERGKVISRYAKVVNKAQFITADEMETITKNLSEANGRPIVKPASKVKEPERPQKPLPTMTGIMGDLLGFPSLGVEELGVEEVQMGPRTKEEFNVARIETILDRLIRQLYSITDASKIKQMQEINFDILKYGEKNPEFKADEMKDRIALASKAFDESPEGRRLKSQRDAIYARQEAEKLSQLQIKSLAIDELIEQTAGELFELSSLESNRENREAFKEIVKSYIRQRFGETIEAGRAINVMERMGNARLPNTLKRTVVKALNEGKPLLMNDPYYRPDDENSRKRDFIVNGEAKHIETGMGLVSDMHKHFKEDEKMLKAVARKLEDSDSSSDEEAKKELKRHIKATKKVDKKIDKALVASGDEVGLGFKAKKIPLKKVGKGIQADETPTYREFGKYIVHIPYLLNNVANFKYPSKGAIPSIKPMTISEDYKDFLIDLLNTGKMNETVYKHLPTEEIKHFERVAKGAGIADKIGLKPSHTDEDRKEAQRFEVLRGEVLAGNNSDSVLKELRMLIVKFMNSGRLHKSEGTEMLMTLATL